MRVSTRVDTIISVFLDQGLLANFRRSRLFAFRLASEFLFKLSISQLWTISSHIQWGLFTG